MRDRRLTTGPMLLLATGGLVVGLALPAAAHEASSLINGKSIAVRSLPGDRLKNNTLTGKQIKESTLGTVPKAKHLPALVWHRLTLKNGWVSGSIATPGYRAPAYAVDAQGLVHFRGTMAGGNAGTVAFTLPKALRPKKGLFISSPMLASGAKEALLTITATGAMPGPGDASSTDVTDLSILEGIVYDPR
jgi:hypothetical protein